MWAMTVLTPRPTTADLVRGVVVAVLAILQVLVSAFGGSGIGAVARDYDTPLLAAGWAFSIWGVIYALAITQAVGVLAAGAEQAGNDGNNAARTERR